MNFALTAVHIPQLHTAQESLVLEYIKDIRAKDPGIGRDFQGNDPVGRDRFVEVVDRYGLKVRNKTRKPKTTDSSHGLPTYPNIIKDFIPSKANQLWVSDITYITIWFDEYHYVFSYLSLVLDAYTEEIAGWGVGPTLETCYPSVANGSSPITTHISYSIGWITIRARAVNSTMTI